MTQKRQELGKDGEILACAELESRGYAILERRYRTRYGEIDVIARDGETLAFVEVRRKSADDFGFAAESVTRDKQRRIVRMALDYLGRAELVDTCPVRFDVVAIDDQPVGPPRLTVFVGAFDGW
jgi:putative endonuclease